MFQQPPHSLCSLSLLCVYIQKPLQHVDGTFGINVTPSTSERADTTGGSLDSDPSLLGALLLFFLLLLRVSLLHRHLSHPSANNTHVCRRGNSLLLLLQETRQEMLVKEEREREKEREKKDRKSFVCTREKRVPDEGDTALSSLLCDHTHHYSDSTVITPKKKPLKFIWGERKLVGDFPGPTDWFVESWIDGNQRVIVCATSLTTHSPTPDVFRESNITSSSAIKGINNKWNETKGQVMRLDKSINKTEDPIFPFFFPKQQQLEVIVVGHFFFSLSLFLRFFACSKGGKMNDQNTTRDIRPSLIRQNKPPLLLSV